jgi:hypothetical protein
MDILKQMSNGTNNKCFTCGKGGHFANTCEKNTNLETESEYEDIWCCEYCEKEFREKNKCEYHEKCCKLNNKKKFIYEDEDDDEEDEDDDDEEEDDDDDEDCCFRCGRNGHYASSCYASKHINGYYLK